VYKWCTNCPDDTPLKKAYYRLKMDLKPYYCFWVFGVLFLVKYIRNKCSKREIPYIEKFSVFHTPNTPLIPLPSDRGNIISKIIINFSGGNYVFYAEGAKYHSPRRFLLAYPPFTEHDKEQGTHAKDGNVRMLGRNPTLCEYEQAVCLR